MSGFLNPTDEEGTVTKADLLDARNGTRPIAVCEECQEQYSRKRGNQRFCSARCAGRFNAKLEYGPTGKAPKDREEALVEAIEAPPRPLQPFADDELATIAGFAGIDVAKVRGIAWLTALKLAVDV